MRHILFFVLMTCMLWSACTQDPDIDTGSDVPVFKVSIDGDSVISRTAGLDGCYLFTQVNRGNDEVLSMTGAFADAKCPTGDCPSSLRFEFRNIHQDNFVDVNSLFFEGANWTYKSPTTSPPAYGTVAIQWVNANGSKSRSDWIIQPQDSTSFYFRILSSEPWENNERGELTWKMDVAFSCFLFDTLQGQELKIGGQGTIAVAYR